MRALLIVNPHATSTTQLRRDVIAGALASAVELEVVETRYRGHATPLAADALGKDCDLVLTLGGDGTVNEAINGILSAGAARRPALAALPGGHANVFTRALGLPVDPIDATGWILQALARGRERSIGLGLASGRYFAFNAGLGFDAEVVRAVDGQRAHGRLVTPALYTKMALRQYYRTTDRRHPPLTLELDGQPPAGPLFFSIISNTAPWTYLGRHAVITNPRASFDSGLDVFAMRSMHTLTTFRTLRKVLSAGGTAAHGSGVLALHDQAELTLSSIRPVAFQLDGEYMGERERVRFSAVADALRVIV